MSSNFERLHEIINQADSESYSSLCHVEPRNLPRSLYPMARKTGPFVEKYSWIGELQTRYLSVIIFGAFGDFGIGYWI